MHTLLSDSKNDKLQNTIFSLTYCYTIPYNINAVPYYYTHSIYTWFSSALGYNGVIPHGWGREGPVISGDVVLFAQYHLIQEHDANVVASTSH